MLGTKADMTAAARLQSEARKPRTCITPSMLAVLRGLVQNGMTLDSEMPSEYETAYAATTDNTSNTSIKTYAKHRHHQKKEKKKEAKKKKEKKKRLSSRGRRRRDINVNGKGNDCTHCNKFERRKPHPHIPHNKCMWNKKYKGYRFKSICDELEVNFKPRHKFSSKMGGYKDPNSDEESE